MPNRKVYIVTGAPGSGKTTYVKQHIKPGDLVIDLDSIYSAISGQPSHTENNSLLDIAYDIRDYLYSEVENPKGKWDHAYIITASASRQKIDALKKRFKASEIRMITNLEKCIEQIRSDETRHGMENHYISLAERWYMIMEGR